MPVRAVVLETTGEISVLHGQTDLDPELLHGVHRGPVRSPDAPAPDRENRSGNDRGPSR